MISIDRSIDRRRIDDDDDDASTESVGSHIASRRRHRARSIIIIIDIDSDSGYLNLRRNRRDARAVVDDVVKTTRTRTRSGARDATHANGHVCGDGHGG